MRTFIGISLSDVALTRCVKLQEGLVKSGVRGNFTAKSNIHVTLEFLGEQNEENIKKIIKIMENIEFNKFSIKITKLTDLKDMVILEVEKSEELIKLQIALHDRLKDEGFRIEDRPYYPHITLVREAKMKINKDILIESEIREVTLFSSTRINNRLVYNPIYKRG